MSKTTFKTNPRSLEELLRDCGGGKIQPGRPIASSKGTPLCNLYVSMLDCMGTPVEKLGDSTGALALT